VGQPAGIKVIPLLLSGKASSVFPLCKICHLGETLTPHLSQYFSAPFSSEITVYLNRSFLFRQELYPEVKCRIATVLTGKQEMRYNLKRKKKMENILLRKLRYLTDESRYDRLLVE